MSFLKAGCLGYGSEMEASLPLLEILVLDLGLLFLVNKIVTCNVANLLLNHNGGMQNKKGRTVTFRVDESVAEKLEKYARMRNTSMSSVLRNWCESSDLRVELPKKARRKLELIARGRKRHTVGKLIEDAVKRVL